MSDPQAAQPFEPKVQQATPAQVTEPTLHARKASSELAESATAVGKLRDDVESGRLQLDPAAGEEIVAMLSEQKDQVDAWLKRADDLARGAPLGQNPVGEAMATKFQNRAQGTGDHAYTGVLTQYRQVLEDAHDAVGDAMRQYRVLEEQTAESFQKLIQ